MLEQRHQGHRRGFFGSGLGEQEQEPPGGGLRERPPGGIVGLDVPAAQVMHDAAGEPAVGRDHRNALFRLFQRLAHQQRDRLRFLLGIGRLEQAHARKPPLVGGQIDPRLARLGRQEQVRDRVAALGRALAEPGAVPRLDLAARDPHPVEQQLEVILRMRHRVAARERGLLLGRPGAAELVPHLGRHRQVEVGQDHRALRQLGNDAQQLAPAPAPRW